MFLGKFGLYPGQPRLLFILWKEDGRSQRELVEKLKVSPATVTVMLNRMERSGFLERRSDHKDLRISRVFLTDKGKEVRQQVEEIFQNVERECFNGFAEEEIVLFRQMLIKIRNNFVNSSKK
ncbi:MAG: MarR family transcriptional regulator [Eubacteriales bacterium]